MVRVHSLGYIGEGEGVMFAAFDKRSSSAPIFAPAKFIENTKNQSSANVWFRTKSH